MSENVKREIDMHREIDIYASVLGALRGGTNTSTKRIFGPSHQGIEGQRRAQAQEEEYPKSVRLERSVHRPNYRVLVRESLYQPPHEEATAREAHDRPEEATDVAYQEGVEYAEPEAVYVLIRVPGPERQERHGEEAQAPHDEYADEREAARDGIHAEPCEDAVEPHVEVFVQYEKVEAREGDGHDHEDDDDDAADHVPSIGRHRPARPSAARRTGVGSARPAQDR